MDMDFIHKLTEIQSFVTLKDIFESWVKDGVIDERGSEIQLGYVSLISYPSIYLTKDGAEREIAAAKDCYQIMMKYSKSQIAEAQSSDDQKTQLASSLYTLPPEKYMLMLCGEFFLLEYYLNGLYANYTDEQLATVDGDEYAKVWFNILSTGYHFEQTVDAINKDHDHFARSMNMIIKMHLSPEYRERVDVENIKREMQGYYDKQGGNNGGGCLSMIIFFIATSLIAACSL